MKRRIPKPWQPAGPADRQPDGEPASDASSSDASWGCCYRTPIEVEAHVVRGFLEHYGVPCVIRHDRFSVQPLTFCAFGKVEILVPSDWLKVAEGLIAGRSQQTRRRKNQSSVVISLEGKQHVQD